MLSAIFYILTGLCFAGVLTSGLMRPRENRDNPEVRARDIKLRKTGMVFLGAAVLFLVLATVFR